MSKNSNQRADVKNPNNSSHKAAVDNRSVQLNTPATGKSPSQENSVKKSQ